jgi:hypothetical protein
VLENKLRESTVGCERSRDDGTSGSTDPYEFLLPTPALKFHERSKFNVGCSPGLSTRSYFADTYGLQKRNAVFVAEKTIPSLGYGTPVPARPEGLRTHALLNVPVHIFSQRTMSTSFEIVFGHLRHPKHSLGPEFSNNHHPDIYESSLRKASKSYLRQTEPDKLAGFITTPAQRLHPRSRSQASHHCNAFQAYQVQN